MRARDMHLTLASKLGIWRNDNLPFVGRVSTKELVFETISQFRLKNGVELGATGTFTELICKTNPNLQLTCINNWSGTEMGAFTEKTSGYKVVLQKSATLDAVQQVAPQSLDLLFVNPTGRFDQIILDLIHWVPKVRSGGMVMGSYFCNMHRGGVIPAVEAYVRSHNIVPWYVTKLDVEPIWFWVN